MPRRSTIPLAALTAIGALSVSPRAARSAMRSVEGEKDLSPENKEQRRLQRIAAVAGTNRAGYSPGTFIESRKPYAVSYEQLAIIAEQHRIGRKLTKRERAAVQSRIAKEVRRPPVEVDSNEVP